MPESEAAAATDHESLVDLAEALLEEARAMRSRWEELDQLIEQLGTPPAEDRAVPERSASLGGDQHDPARLMAIEYQRAGRSRAETADYLETAFGLRPDPTMLDEVFGPHAG